MAVCHLNIAFKGGINAVTTLGCLQVHIGHIGPVAHRLPEYVTLIMTQVEAMNMLAGILTLHIGIRLLDHERVLCILRNELNGEKEK